MTKFPTLSVQRLFVSVAAGLAVLLAGCGTPPSVLTSPTQPPVDQIVQSTVVARTPTAAVAYPQPSLAGAAAPSATSTALLPIVARPPAPDLQFSGEDAYGYVQAQMQWVPRTTGTPGWQQVGDYIVDTVQAAGWQVEEQRFDYQNVSVRNIIAKKGRGPVLILGAHYDTRRYADNDPDPANRTKPVPGANDAASGVAVLLELAEHIDTEALGREVWLTFFDAEDNGNIDGWDWTVGSNYMAQNLQVRPKAMVLLDMIGDADLNIYYERTSTFALSESIWDAAAALGYTQFVPQPKYSVLDDHTPFLNQDIPAVDLIDFDYPQWHTVNDTIEFVSADSLEAVGRTMEYWLETRAAP